MRRQSTHPMSRRVFFACGDRFRSDPAQSAGERWDRCIRGNAPRSHFSAQRRAAAIRYARRKGEHGSAILESFLCMILIGMIPFGVLQLFQLALADMFAEYAAFRGARSHVVGFNDNFAFREALIKAAPASGPIVTPDPKGYPGFYSDYGETEKSLLRSFMQDDIDMDYAYWNDRDLYHTNYHCPDYGKRMVYLCETCNDANNCCGGRPHVKMQETGIPTVGSCFHFSFVNYPLELPLYDWLTGRESITISSKVELERCPVFLE